MADDASNKSMTFGADLLPLTSNSYSLGSNTKKWLLNGGVPVLTSDLNLGAAASKNVDSSLGDTQQSSVNLPTSAAVIAYVNNAIGSGSGSGGTGSGSVKIINFETDAESFQGGDWDGLPTPTYIYDIIFSEEEGNSITPQTVAITELDQTSYYNLNSDLVTYTDYGRLTIATDVLPEGPIRGTILLINE